MATTAPRTGGARIKSLDAILATAEKKSLKRSLGAFQLTMLGIGAVIGTGIFVLTATAAQKAGPGMMVSFIVAGFVCALAALCYSELASLVPVAGSVYTYSFAVMGETVAWLVGWALILEYALGASAVAVGWSGFISGLLDSVGVHLPHALKVGPPIECGFLQGGAGPGVSGHMENFHPFAPRGWGNPLSSSGTGILGAAASIFFAYVGFDAVSTAAAETRISQRNVLIGLIASRLSCTLFYLLAAGGAVGAYGAQPLAGPNGPFDAGSPDLA